MREQVGEVWKLVERQDEAVAIERRRVGELEEALRGALEVVDGYGLSLDSGATSEVHRILHAALAKEGG